MNEKNELTLKHWQSTKTKKDYKSIICECNADAINFISKCRVKVINGSVPCEDEALIIFKKVSKILCNKASPDKRRRSTIASTKGIRLLKVISGPISSFFTQRLLKNLPLNQTRTTLNKNPKRWKFQTIQR